MQNTNSVKCDKDVKSLIKCDTCEKEFSLRRNFYYHKKFAHADMESYACNFCEKRFSWKITLDSHINLLHGNQNETQLHECDHCDKKFSSKLYLRSHVINVHQNGKHKCLLCGEEFKNLNGHIIIRTSLKWLSDHKRSLACDFSLV